MAIRLSSHPGPRAVYVDLVEADVSIGRILLERAGFDVHEAVAGAEGEVIEAARAATALLVGDAPVTRGVFTALPELRIVATATVGVDHVDVAAACEHGVWVSNVPDAATEEVAVHALAMCLALIRQLPAWDRHVRDGGWSVLGARRLRRPSTMTLSVIGLGRIGRKLAQLGQPVFGSVVGSDPYLAERGWPLGVDRLDLDDAFAAADVVSLHAPLTEETERLVDEERLARMKSGGFLVNVARGRLVDADALVRALDAGVLAGAGLDVLPNEPPDPADPLVGHPQIALSPHVAFLSDEAQRDYLVRQAENVVEWWQRGRPLTPVVEVSDA